MGARFLSSTGLGFGTLISETKKLPVPVLKGKKRSQSLAPVLVIISGNSLVFSRKIITSTGFYRCCAAGASAPVVVKIQSPIIERAQFFPVPALDKNRSPKLSASKSCDSLRLRRRFLFLPLPKRSHYFLRPQDARFPLRREKSLANRDFFCEENG